MGIEMQFLCSILLIVGGYISARIFRNSRVLDAWWYTFLPMVLGYMWLMGLLLKLAVDLLYVTK